jgi:hypothetical protein
MEKSGKKGRVQPLSGVGPPHPSVARTDWRQTNCGPIAFDGPALFCFQSPTSLDELPMGAGWPPVCLSEDLAFSPTNPKSLELSSKCLV